MHPVPPDPAALPDPTDLLRSRSYVVVLLFAALIGVPVAALAYLYLAVVTKGEHWLYASLPSDLGFAGAPVWWPLPLLALAALADPKILVLNEATSNLDPGTEHAVEAALEALMSGRTVIVVAHRLSTAARADRVAVVDGGGIAEIGTHDELVARGGHYAALYAAWQSHHAAH